MLELIKEVTDHLKRGSTITSGSVFFLHNTFTCILVLGMSLITTAMEHYGSNIKCIPEVDREVDVKIEYDKIQDFFTTFCWINSTFTFDKGSASDFWEIGERKYYSYYKWVGGALLLQAVLFYIPKIVWDSLDRGLMRKLAKDFKYDKDFKECSAEKKEAMVKILLTLLERNKRYAVNYWLCEVLCLLNVFSQLFFVNKFFDGEFLSYGYNVLAFWLLGESYGYGFMNHIFPKVTRCTFHKDGAFKRHEFLCVLPLNIVNEKTYLIFWFWLLTLICLLVLLMIYRMALLLRSSLRIRHLCFRNRLLPKVEAVFIATEMDVSDWWILYMLNRNIDAVTFRDVMVEMVKTIKLKRRLIREMNDGIEMNDSTEAFFYS